MINYLSAIVKEAKKAVRLKLDPHAHIISLWSAKASHHPFTVWPDGCRDLIVILAPGCPARIKFTGLDTTAYTADAPKGTLFWGVRLAPGTLLKPVKKEVLAEFGPRRLNRCLDKDMSTFLLQAVCDWFVPRKTIVTEFFEAIKDAQDKIPRLTQSSRTLRRKIGAATGASPQFWMGLKRLRKSAHDIVFSKTCLVDIALCHGYADQAHLTRQMGRWLGITPAFLRKNAETYRRVAALADAFCGPKR